jgi:hypothetical protein
LAEPKCFGLSITVLIAADHTNQYSVMGIRHEDLDATLAHAAEDIPAAVVGIYSFWRQ